MGSKSELTRAGTCATGRNQNRPDPNWEMWYQIAVQARKSKSKKLHHRGEVKLQ